LLTHAAAQRVAGHDAAQHVGGCGNVFPVLLGEAIDVLQEHRTLRQQIRLWAMAVVQGPFQAGVANIKGDERHGVNPQPRWAG
jgi:hypothetical protein